MNIEYLHQIKNRLRSKDTTLLIFVVLAACLYFVFNIPQASINILKTSFDDVIPRVPIFAVPYLLFIPWLWSVILYAWYNNRSFRQLALASIVINLIACAVYITFQTYIPRDVVISDDFFSGILRFIYEHDQAYNGFPSLHSALSVMVATYYVCIKSRWSWLFIVIASTIVASTLFVKQHFVADAVSGVILGVIVTLIVFRLSSAKVIMQKQANLL